MYIWIVCVGGGGEKAGVEITKVTDTHPKKNNMEFSNPPPLFPLNYVVPILKLHFIFITIFS